MLIGFIREAEVEVAGEESVRSRKRAKWAYLFFDRKRYFFFYNKGKEENGCRC